MSHFLKIVAQTTSLAFDAQAEDSPLVPWRSGLHVKAQHPVFSADGRRIHFNVSNGPWTQFHVAECGSK